MRLWLVLALLFTTGTATLLVAQESLIENIGFGVEIYPHLSNRRLLAGPALGFAEATRIDSLERSDFGYGAGIYYAQRVQRIGFHLGLRYLITGYQTDNDILPGQVPSNDPILFSQTYTTQLLEIPFQVNFYQNFGTKTSFYFTLGAAAGIHLNSTYERTVSPPEGNAFTEEFEVDEDYRSLNFAMIAAIGFEQRFDKITIGLQPTFEYWLGGNIRPREQTDLNRNLYNLGLRLTGQFSTY